ncbi:hypothetical protein K461DRAFT_27644 [Myriangium duriaei CBS 260.36]|uniref:Myb-like domain-containing protein n=1 Tax=Myriangium duriaei CBS 260.36 TaxID=1168546 RepID=A0A9P4JE72_9PEZI|nr:hypothetical protein K461DRAFT_27644 [Myriangium duriaei CBS 260.36]
MSDTEQSTPATPTVPATQGDIKFTEKEERVLKVVWGCMKSLPEVDMTKLTTAAGFQTQKTCANTWGVIKKKLVAQAAANGVEIDLSSKPGKAPAKTSPKKRVKSEADADGVDGGDEGQGGNEPPTKPKKVRKSPTKKSAKSEVKVEAGDDEDAASVGAAE